jgi:hypothetical protein
MAVAEVDVEAAVVRIDLAAVDRVAVEGVELPLGAEHTA